MKIRYDGTTTNYMQRNRGKGFALCLCHTKAKPATRVEDTLHAPIKKGETTLVVSLFCIPTNRPSLDRAMASAVVSQGKGLEIHLHEPRGYRGADGLDPGVVRNVEIVSQPSHQNDVDRLGTARLTG